MIIGIILAIVIIAFVIVAGYGAYLCFENDKTFGGISLILAVIILIGTFVIVPFSFHTVDTGEIAVVKHFGEAKETRPAGLHWDIWVTNQYEMYDAKVQKVDIKANTYSSDAQTMDVKMTLQYQIQPDKAVEITKKYGSLNLLQQRLKSIVIEKSKAILSSHKAMNIIANRAAMSPAVEESIKKAVSDKYYVDINSVVLTNIDFSDAFEKAVENKMIAEQKQLKAEYENKTKIAKAKAEADAKLIKAKATAEANKKLEKSLTPKILKQLYLDKWDGKLPKYITDKNSSVLFNAN